MGGAVIKFSSGTPSAAAANAGYITRSSAAEKESLSFHNAPENVRTGFDHTTPAGWQDQKMRIQTWAQMRQEEEISRHGNRVGSPRTHYRTILSFEEKISSGRATKAAQAWLEEEFPDARGFSVVHQDTDNTHVHVWLSARKANGSKINVSRSDFESMTAEWDRIYSQTMGREGKLKEKMEETKQFKRTLAQMKERGANAEVLREVAEANRPDRATPPGPAVYRRREERLARPPEGAGGPGVMPEEFLDLGPERLEEELSELSEGRFSEKSPESPEVPIEEEPLRKGEEVVFTNEESNEMVEVVAPPRALESSRGAERDFELAKVYRPQKDLEQRVVVGDLERPEREPDQQPEEQQSGQAQEGANEVEGAQQSERAQEEAATEESVTGEAATEEDVEEVIDVIGENRIREEAARGLREEARSEISDLEDQIGALESEFEQAVRRKFADEQKATDAYRKNRELFESERARQATVRPDGHGGAFEKPEGPVTDPSVDEDLKALSAQLHVLEKERSALESAEEVAERIRERSSEDGREGLPSSPLESDPPESDPLEKIREPEIEERVEERIESEKENIQARIVEEIPSSAAAVQGVLEKVDEARERELQAEMAHEIESIEQSRSVSYESRKLASATQEGGGVNQEIMNGMRAESAVLQARQNSASPSKELREASKAMSGLQSTGDGSEMSPAKVLEEGLERDNEILRRAGRTAIKKASEGRREDGREVIEEVRSAWKEARKTVRTTASTATINKEIEGRIERMEAMKKALLRSRADQDRRADQDPRAEEAFERAHEAQQQARSEEAQQEQTPRATSSEGRTTIEEKGRSHGRGRPRIEDSESESGDEGHEKGGERDGFERSC